MTDLLTEVTNYLAALPWHMRERTAATLLVRCRGELATQAERCAECNGELSYCGEQDNDGVPKLDCRLCQLQLKLTKQAEQVEALKALLNDWRRIYHKDNVTNIDLKFAISELAAVLKEKP